MCLKAYECKVHLKELSNWPMPKPSQTWFPTSGVAADHPHLFALALSFLGQEQCKDHGLDKP